MYSRLNGQWPAWLTNYLTWLVGTSWLSELMNQLFYTSVLLYYWLLTYWRCKLNVNLKFGHIFNLVQWLTKWRNEKHQFIVSCILYRNVDVNTTFNKTGHVRVGLVREGFRTNMYVVRQLFILHTKERKKNKVNKLWDTCTIITLLVIKEARSA